MTSKLTYGELSVHIGALMSVIAANEGALEIAQGVINDIETSAELRAIYGSTAHFIRAQLRGHIEYLIELYKLQYETLQ
jgi:hypothetical protein